MSLIGLLVFLIVIGLVFWAVSQLASAFAVPLPVVKVVYVLLVVIVVLWLLQTLGLWSGSPVIRVT
jgi:hypothetical protein